MTLKRTHKAVSRLNLKGENRKAILWRHTNPASSF